MYDKLTHKDFLTHKPYAYLWIEHEVLERFIHDEHYDRLFNRGELEIEYCVNFDPSEFDDAAGFEKVTSSCYCLDLRTDNDLKSAQ